MSRTEAAAVATRLRGLAFDGQAIIVTCQPSLPRSAVRQARLHEARLRRDGSLGFARRGAWLDEEARYSLTPEVLAYRIGRLARRADVVDAACGAGGNAIGFARAGCRVLAIERDRERAEMARHNLRLYGVQHRVRVRCGDALEHVARLSVPLVFVDPPWGREYDPERVTVDDLPLLRDLLEQVPANAAVWAKVPSSFDTRGCPARVLACFGAGSGDRRRVKFLLLRFPPRGRT
ncbi:MAG: hypothetical protein B7733_22760 [Myxococcales bacterium FL481]|nr:MAG: hypothetical protein B7733_22760 [Myxococcales bacterium FL481]